MESELFSEDLYSKPCNELSGDEIDRLLEEAAEGIIKSGDVGRCEWCKTAPTRKKGVKIYRIGRRDFAVDTYRKYCRLLHGCFDLPFEIVTQVFRLIALA